MNQNNKIYRGISDFDLSVQIGIMAEENFAEEVKIIDVKNLSCVADYLVLMTGNSSAHINSLCNKIDKPLRLVRDRLGMEGRMDNAEWVLLDYGTIIVHIFDSSARIYYNLDEFWNGEIIFWEDFKRDKKRG